LVFLRSVRRLLVTASVVPSLPIFFTLVNVALSSSETSVLTRATRPNIPEDAVLHSHRSENLKSYRINIVLRILLTSFLSPFDIDGAYFYFDIGIRNKCSCHSF
jgi:hypothetical protein